MKQTSVDMTIDKVKTDSSFASKEQLSYDYWLHSIPGIGNKKLTYLMKQGIYSKDVFEMPVEDLKNIWRYIYPLKSDGSICVHAQRDIDNIMSNRCSRNPLKEYELLCKQNIEFIPIYAEHYPERLKRIPDAPFAIYRKGKLHDEEEKTGVSVAVVGARQCSSYGKDMAVFLGKSLAQYGIRLVSGLASGVDGIAQNAARMNGGLVTAVLGNGIDICYPTSNKRIYDALINEGEIISEYVPGTQPRAQNFPPRNRIISGLADAVIVVEAKERSGTLITVDMALEQGREVIVVPGRLTDPMSYGCNKLISQGAGIVYNVEEALLDIIENAKSKKKDDNNQKRSYQEENMQQINAKPAISLPVRENPYEIDSLKGQLFLHMDYLPVNVQKLYEILESFTVAEITSALMQMEMDGYIVEEGGRYRL